MKFGCIAPSVIQLPWDLQALLPAGVSALTVTLNVRNGLPGEHERATEQMQRAADVLIDEGARAIVVQGVPVAARRGYAADCKALEALTVARGALPIISSLAATALALKQLGVHRPLFVTQYNEPTNKAIADYCSDAGVRAAGAIGLGATNAAEVNALTAGDYEALARRALGSHPDADSIFLSARGNLLATTRTLEASLNLPVIDQVRASVWWALRQFDRPDMANAILSHSSSTTD